MIKEYIIDGNTAKSVAAAKAFYMDAVSRSRVAASRNSFFDSDHMQRVNTVRTIVDTFFPVKNDVYINHREGRGKPFSVVKVAHIGLWPTRKDKYRDLYAPLEALGVTEVLLSKNTNSYLFRVR